MGGGRGRRVCVTGAGCAGREVAHAVRDPSIPRQRRCGHQAGAVVRVESSAAAAPPLQRGAARGTSRARRRASGRAPSAPGRAGRRPAARAAIRARRQTRTRRRQSRTRIRGDASTRADRLSAPGGHFTPLFRLPDSTAPVPIIPTPCCSSHLESVERARSVRTPLPGQSSKIVIVSSRSSMVPK